MTDASSVILLRNQRWAGQLGAGVSTLSELRASKIKGTVLIAFCSGVIVPSDVLQRVTAAYNFHPATPQFPGRDPHHWAVYERADTLGATCHVMTERVDEGPIIRVLRFPLLPEMTPSQVRDLGEQAALQLHKELLPSLIANQAEPSSEAWSGTKRIRADFHRMCEIPPGLDREEVRRREFAFSMPGHQNLKFLSA